ncbi:MAG TPA: cytochrome c, partial [Verrucomicrobiae bacterium]|nr:cytochrome c [Verrucomicrobiae bacterium]
LMAIVLTAAALVGSLLYVNATRKDYNTRLNPPPQIVNNVLPDADSLARGERLYVDHCIDWQAHSQDFAALKNRLPRTRDEELFAFTRDGWQALPPCTGDLNAAQRWDIVNFIRTFEAAT